VHMCTDATGVCVCKWVVVDEQPQAEQQGLLYTGAQILLAYYWVSCAGVCCFGVRLSPAPSLP
jgi:hypothetical protein